MRSFAGAGKLDRARLREAPIHWPRPSVLDVSLLALDGVGPKLAEAAAGAGIATIGDLLMRFPHSHRDRRIEPLAEIESGRRATVSVEVLGSRPSQFRRRGLSILSVKVGDRSGSVRATWFNQPWLARKLAPGTALLLTGSRDRHGFRVAEYEFSGSSPAGAEEVVPVHPGTERLKAQRLREWAEQACRWAPNALEGLPAELRARRRLAGSGDAIRAIHFPSCQADVDRARERLGFEELFLYQALLASRKRAHRLARPAPRLGAPGDSVRRWIASLPFALTGDQLRAFEEIDADLDSGQPMQRLLMGEVGSGKTVVALYSMLRALEAGYQAVLMAPTETLAEQHARTLGKLLAEEATPFALLSGATPAAIRRQALERLASGELGLIVGTHALIEPAVRFARLGLCVVDEQHRFGVRQRRALDAKGVEGMVPHVLQMSATPIPRTLSLTAYGDLDTTALHEVPAGRGAVLTRVLAEEGRAGAYRFIRERLGEGRQAYVVCPLVEESETLGGKAAEAEAQRLAGAELRGFAIDVIHGQMPSAHKARVMEAFAAGATDVLVATTVIEVGIDVPNATVMLIEGAERYGVSQLHQLRGRVGRGEHPSQCLLFAERAGGSARRRLQAVAGESDGFRLAEIDLGLRGEGEILGTRQHGLPRFAVASLPEDTPLLIAAREEVLELLHRHGSLDAPALGPLLDAARSRFGAGSSDLIAL
ncbi:MAG: ATP-dependent DNA helicase RecG [Solirubrobacterales bacterium]